MAHTNLYNISAGQSFAKTLAQYVLEQTKDAPETLSDIRILLPTRRACRVLQDAFLKLSQGKALLLPRFQPIGDIDEEELSLSSPYGDLALKLPPAIAPIKRQILLARLIEKRADFKQSFDQALELAKALGHFMDQIYTENLDMKDLAELVPEDFADHWQITLKFLEILSEAWPEILAEQNVIDIADRRNRLILALNNHWQKTPPAFPVIAAGTTGSIPATADLLKTISGFESGKIILPGLDTEIDDKSWDTLEETHPQFGLRELLNHLNVERHAVKPLNKQELKPQQTLAREIMRSGETTQAWTTFDQNDKSTFETALSNIEFYTCDHEQEEADIIALLMREVLEKKDETACLVTPDRSLAARVQTALKRWNITIDDSAGTPLLKTHLGIFLMLILKACETNLSPTDTLALLKNPHLPQQNIAALDIALRGQKPGTGYEGLLKHIAAQPRLSDSIKIESEELLKTLVDKIEPFLTMYEQQEKTSFTALLKTHLRIAETLYHGENLWNGEIGQSASTFFSELLIHAHTLPEINPQDYRGTLEAFMSGLTIRPSYGTHPRLQILGQLEARLIDADLVILSGLNEGTWPPDAGADPWMSRPMRKKFGLPSAERSIGLSAHDFVQGFCAPKTVITRSKQKNGAPTVPARWLQRLESVIQAADIDSEQLKNQKALSWHKHLKDASTTQAVSRPSPYPPVHARPKSLSVTKIETWLKDPYSIYANSILKLKKLDDLEQPLDAAAKGSMLHAILDEFIQTNPSTLPENSAEILQDTAAKHIERQEDPATWQLWQSRFNRISHWFIDHEQTHRENAKPLKTEAKGHMKFGDFTLTGIADRIDKTADSGIIIDYKSGGTFSKKALSNGEYPQLPLEALILQNSGFDDVKPMQTSSLQYWVLNGSGEGGKVTSTGTDIEDLLSNIQTKFENLITIFNDPKTPYLSLPRPDKVPRFNDYLHLARVQEWSTLSDSSESEAA